MIHGQDDEAARKWEEYQKLAQRDSIPVKGIQ
jgi:hypothetical protein